MAKDQTAMTMKTARRASTKTSLATVVATPSRETPQTRTKMESQQAATTS